MSSHTLQIRHATQDDLKKLLDLYQHLTPGDERAEPERASDVFEKFLAYEGSAIFLGESNATLVVSCTLVVVPNLTRGGTPYALIENVVTAEPFRGCGYGKQILDAATSWAWQNGCYKVMLMTGTKRPSTIRFYMAAGFEQSKTGFQKRRMVQRAET